jgi:hypothetical protein
VHQQSYIVTTSILPFTPRASFHRHQEHPSNRNWPSSHSSVSQHEVLRGRCLYIAMRHYEHAANFCKALNPLPAVSSALIPSADIEPTIDTNMEPSSLTIRQSSVALPTATIYYFNGPNCQPEPNEGFVSDFVRFGEASGTCARAPEFFFNSALAEANVPSGFNCNL